MNFFSKMGDLNAEKENTNTAVEKTKCLIIGSGPAGYTAAIYASRAGLKPIIYQGLQPGGQLTTTTEVENFPGYPEGVTGPQMMEDLQKQAERFGADNRWGIATKVDFSTDTHKVWFDDGKIIEADAVIIATGATAKYLGLESEKKYMGFGVSACATCDGFFYRNQDVAVVGGGDTACEEATYLSGICNKVYLIVRKDYLRASKAMQERVLRNPKIQVLFEHNTKEIFGDKAVDGVKLIDKNGTEKDIKVTGYFVAIGHQPNSEIFKPYIDMDETGYINTIKGSTKTNVKGVFAAGDVQDKHYRQAITAAASGCMAALDAERYLGEKN
ncbi:MAG TPA: thioredoxin-disulfide reductase [Bacteroidales bacterium]|nr:MAG: thioredoxin-disulfide reductase [Bacteroidetes bacterium GWF2_33_38]HBF88227.1 thioredoxin-disulfide reductase [Bacteroidales bacterium]